MTAATLDKTRMDAFATRMADILNGGALSLMASIGHRTGLFDALATLPPASSAAIAAAAGLQERYVREWLGAMVTGGIVDYDPLAETYALPPEHGAFLTRAAGSNNMAVFAQAVGLLGTVEDAVSACFRDGGGVPYAAVPRFHAIMAEASDASMLPKIVAEILPLAPGLPARLAAGIDVLEIGCGRGHALLHLATTYPNSRFTGNDLIAENLTATRAEAAARGVTNLTFVAGDAAALSGTARYDCVLVFDAIHDQGQPFTVLRNIAAALRPGGVFLMAEPGATGTLEGDREHPMAPFFYTISTMHCMAVSLAAGGEGLGAMWGRERALVPLRAAGFTRVDVHQLVPVTGDNFFVCTKD